MVIGLNEISASLLDEYDVFFASASYESRSLSVMRAIHDKIRLNRKIVSVSTPHKSLFAENLNEFLGRGYETMEVDNSKQLETALHILDIITNILKINGAARFLVDITTFTRQTLLILLRILRNLLSSQNVIHFLYTPAKEYAVGFSYQDKWLTKGVLKVNSVFGYSGVIRPYRPYHLIILLGYEVERASSLILAYEPEKITIGYARQDSSISEPHYLLNKEKVEELLIEFPNAESFEFSCIDLLDCKNSILLQVDKYTDCNTVVSPMNNKLSTLSCALAGYDNEKIQIAIAIPAVYNSEYYSSASDVCHFISIPEFVKQ